MKSFCQVTLMVLLGVSALQLLYRDVNGRKAAPPQGFSGVVVTLLLTALVALIYYKAGAFSEIFH